jgi:hypothetical protein
MDRSTYWIREQMDRAGMYLSGLCAIHCVLSLVLVAGLGLSGGFLLNPAIHRVGLLLATLVAAIAIGMGAMRHRRRTPVVVAIAGLCFMAAALAVDHGVGEAVLTVLGVAMVSIGHYLNIRHA